MIKPIGMSIAGLDTGNGAGGESDLRVFEVLGIHGIFAVTALTIQNTKGIKDIMIVDAKFLEKQIETLLEDFRVEGVKIGMIYNKEQFEVIRNTLKDNFLVVDSVLYAKDGTQLIKDVEEYKKIILPIAKVLTPNAIEASYLSGMRIENEKDAISSCKKIRELYNIPYVVVKGGHINAEYSFDVLCFDDGIYKVGYNRLDVKDTHGTGSAFSTAITAEYIKTKDIIESFRRAREFLQTSIEYGLGIGKGIGPINVSSQIMKKSMKYEVMENMIRFADFIERNDKFWILVPEVQSNLAHSIPSEYVRDLNDIATYRGRIIRRWDKKVVVGHPTVFGNPTHTARMLLSIIFKGVNARCLINIRYDEQLLKIFRQLGYDTLEINRELEPKHGEGKTMQWIIDYIYNNYGKVPNIIYDTGTKGKEAMIRFWTSDINELIESLDELLKMV
ncbi:bifunctional hydroxymethylpyrimidine kinase/phosphomethylpyrimidine kinase [Sulfolobus sp. A20]|uniref:bifunctional hydroxymethylpyrimidine kinase/phosphomethylpyrimidine kinase n=2 Tax=Sulfolobaceae TaxID=118883 RepID=UPI000845C932|nr:bifunctional hydroxymethylpyrimidine kinase/phosphomethylpyrimidine kinase [Sulfolobus sp. A20]TRM75396.1 bifunctional hydroxymethylpyrimidine kinase/phosphomethylpyrimidine kinase [Sulfolobus sp. E5]TRM77628.1 bifunctional hydroxymethylpyrimidine kinase/phosphomethylpyrimidine kinase [Sulfolobus sp. B5]TRM78434.1 bifunctional hydroxymethylpyrimidine kinase/phosphomethylpyrimidine kinase [Sulfolobus sp. A20-N-F8]TRM82111.1 bifunctional hydroxymethylpyrimidine kinase/phosphomethylpyrimidine k